MTLGGGGLLLRGKRALVVGLLNKHSLAASVASALLSHGARVVVSSKHPLSDAQLRACGFPPASDVLVRACDVTDDASIEELVGTCSERFGGQLDVLVHSVAFAPREAFANHGGVLATSRPAWQEAMDISAYSLLALTRAAYPLLSSGVDGALARDRSVIALSYAGASRVRTERWRHVIHTHVCIQYTHVWMELCPLA